MSKATQFSSANRRTVKMFDKVYKLVHCASSYSHAVINTSNCCVSVYRYGSVPYYTQLEQASPSPFQGDPSPQQPCPFSDGQIVYMEIKNADIEKVHLYRASEEIYKTISCQVHPENFQLYCVNRGSELKYYLYLSYKDCFIEVQETLVAMPTVSQLPPSSLQPGGLIYTVITLHVTPGPKEAYLLPLYPSRAFLYGSPSDTFYEVSITQLNVSQISSQKICFSDVTILHLTSVPKGESKLYPLPPCTYSGTSDDPR